MSTYEQAKMTTKVVARVALLKECYKMELQFLFRQH